MEAERSILHDVAGSTAAQVEPNNNEVHRPTPKALESGVKAFMEPWTEANGQIASDAPASDLTRLVGFGRGPENDSPSAEELYECLQHALDKVEFRLSLEYPTHAVQHGVENARDTAIDAICNGRAQRMTSPARRSWLYVVARHATVTLLRRKKNASLPDHDIIPSQSETWSALQRELILEALRNLPPDVLVLIEAVYFEGLTGRTAADRLSIAKTTFRRRHAEAILMLRDMFEQLD